VWLDAGHQDEVAVQAGRAHDEELVLRPLYDALVAFEPHDRAAHGEVEGLLGVELGDRRRCPLVNEVLHGRRGRPTASAGIRAEEDRVTQRT
jgi:hypothetical protein